MGKSIVSVLCGYFETEDELMEYIEFDYQDEDNPLSPFLKDYSLDWYDEDFAEASFATEGITLESVKEHSYGESFMNLKATDLDAYSDCNSLLLLYDIDVTQKINPSNGRFRLVGVYSYIKE